MVRKEREASTRHTKSRHAWAKRGREHLARRTWLPLLMRDKYQLGGRVANSQRNNVLRTPYDVFSSHPGGFEHSPAEYCHGFHSFTLLHRRYQMQREENFRRSQHPWTSIQSNLLQKHILKQLTDWKNIHKENCLTIWKNLSLFLVTTSSGSSRGRQHGMAGTYFGNKTLEWAGDRWKSWDTWFILWRGISGIRYMSKHSWQ